MKPLEYPRVSLVWAAVGIVLFLTMALLEAASNAPTLRLAGYLVLLLGTIYMFVRALMTILGKTRPRAASRNQGGE
jgi:hypothetical protein